MIKTALVPFLAILSSPLAVPLRQLLSLEFDSLLHEVSPDAARMNVSDGRFFTLGLLKSDLSVFTAGYRPFSNVNFSSLHRLGLCDYTLRPKLEVSCNVDMGVSFEMDLDARGDTQSPDSHPVTLLAKTTDPSHAVVTLKLEDDIPLSATITVPMTPVFEFSVINGNLALNSYDLERFHEFLTEKLNAFFVPLWIDNFSAVLNSVLA